MMLALHTTATFRRDCKRAQRNPHWRMKDLHAVVGMLADGEALPVKYRDHKLSGEYVDCRECHIRPDWLLVYRIEADRLTLVRTGSHADLFG